LSSVSLNDWVGYIVYLRHGTSLLLINDFKPFTHSFSTEYVIVVLGQFQKGLDMMDTSEPYLCLVDAGLAFNSPYPIVLRPARNVDLILSFEFSDRHGDNNMPFKVR